MTEYKIPIQYRPKQTKDGDTVFLIPKSLIDKNAEKALGLRFICNRRLFGECFRLLMPGFFDSMEYGSGVMIKPFVLSKSILPEMTFPGDIDLLIIPYRNDDLIISRSLAIELKIVRAKFTKQGKSPNEFGFSQATSLLKWGFPYAAVGHLIVSDSSPIEHWRTVLETKVIDSASGKIETPWKISKDMMPSDLIDRCYNRLEKNCSCEYLGLLSSYFTDDSIWFPSGRPAKINPQPSIQTMDKIAEYYNKNAEKFLDTPKFSAA
jgi:hypothetical protein